MAFNLDQVVPWGRSYDEYVAMFALDTDDRHKRILGCGDGPASFNATLTAQGGTAVSCDPLYACDPEAIAARIAATRETVLAQTAANREAFVWTHIPSVDALGDLRMGAMRAFLTDYDTGRQTGRYREGSLPDLPFADDAFDLALCSHLLFLYSEQLDAAFHLAAVTAMIRVAPEVRIFPLLALNGAPSPHLGPVMDTLRARGLQTRIAKVPYEFQRGGDEMLVVCR
jgi:SAM-dependent methyltransferase